MTYGAFKTVFLACLLAVAGAQGGANDTIWTPLFNGKDLDDWVPKIRYSVLGRDSLNTFRVDPCVNSTGNCLDVNYDKYTTFAKSPGGGDGTGYFGHLAYKRPFTHYLMRVEYQFYGNPVKDYASWSPQNNGLMIHAQSPESVVKDQDFPISAESQLRGPKGDDRSMQLCTPGTNYYDTLGNYKSGHCWKDQTLKLDATYFYDSPGWMSVAVEVLGDSLTRHYVGSKIVFAYKKLVQSPGSVSGTGVHITEGAAADHYIWLQSEGAPTRFRKIDLVNLVGCKSNPASPNYRSYFVKDSAAACSATPIVGKDTDHKSFAFDAKGNALSFTLAPAEPYSVRLNDLNGKTVFAGSGRCDSRGYGQVAFGHMQRKGVYFLSLNHGQGVFTQKLLVEK
ncbi:MAG TPA: family 16 glycoside hydrolase [Fibrobacteria bacterium]|nr:family 16 glycoside hydrolase [Fibrobacteria bacterium]